MKLALPHFLFINGPPGSGKSTLASLLTESNPDTFRESFAEPIREMIYSVFFPSDIVTRPIDLRSSPVKSANLLSLAKMGESFRSPSPSVREVMIAFSETFMKPTFGEDIFGRLLFKRCEEHRAFYSHFIIDDCGFTSEASYVISRVGPDACHLIRLHRAGTSYSNDSRGYVSLPGVQTLDLNNDGTPQEMIDMLEMELRE